MLRTLLGSSLFLLTCAFIVTAQRAPQDSELVGLWRAKRHFGPESRGLLMILRAGGGTYTAELMGHHMPVSVKDGELWFELPNGESGFRGMQKPSGAIRGIWFTAPRGSLGSAIPVTLLPHGANRWLGEVVPLDDEQTFHLRVSRRADGSLSAVLRNIERDYGALLGVTGIVRNGNSISLIGRRGAQARDTALITGTIDIVRRVMTLSFPYRGGSYDFRRDNDEYSAFYPRGSRPPRYTYRVPPALEDGWPVANVEDVGIERAAIERAIQQVVDMSMDSIGAPQVHSVLVARKGRLVVEEYFHGEHRYKLHNTRSAAKSVTATIIGAAMFAGAPIPLSAPVYRVMNGGVFPADLEPRKRALTLEHLMTMTSGYFCDDNNEAAPGNEDGMWEQEDEPDFYEFTLPLPMAFVPGERAIYCSINPNLALGMLGRAMNESPFYLFDRLVADPLGIRYYAWPLDRARNPFGGGGMAFYARDFMKFGQLMLDSGTWQGRRILGRDFVVRATMPLVRINNTRDYGLLWWPQDFPYNGRTLRGFAALGNGGNAVMVIPELELVVATNGGNYASRGWRYTTGDLIVTGILPAVR